MRHLKGSIVRFGVLCGSLGAFLLSIAPLPALGQDAPLPAELSFLSAPLKPYRITYEPWAEVQMPSLGAITASAKSCTASTGNSPSLFPAP